MNAYREELTAVLVIADEVDAITLGHFVSSDFSVESKPDLTPVTNADREAEEYIRAKISEKFSDDAIYGEEHGSTGAGSRRWIIDPIDGTKNFVRGVPVWATLIALEVEGTIVLGVVSAPALKRRWWATAGGGAWTAWNAGEPHRIGVSDVVNLSDASFSFSSLSGWEERGMLGGFLGLTRAVWRTRAYGDFWSYMLVAEGSVDIAAEPELELYDMAALVPIVSEAGGTLTDLDGTSGPWGGCALASNGKLHAQAQALLTNR